MWCIVAIRHVNTTVFRQHALTCLSEDDQALITNFSSIWRQWDLIESNCFGVKSSPRKCSAIILQFFILQRPFLGSPLKSWHTCPPKRKTAGIWFWFLWILKLHDCCQLSGREIWTQSQIFFSGFCDINGSTRFSDSSRSFSTLFSPAASRWSALTLDGWISLGMWL